MNSRKELVNSRLKWIKENSSPLSIEEWENIHIGAEFPAAGILSKKENSQQLAKNILILSEEIRRLRYKCGEKVWNCVWEDDEDIKAIKDAYRKKTLGL